MLQLLRSDGANACEWQQANGGCWVEFGSGCYVETGYGGWWAAVFNRPASSTSVQALDKALGGGRSRLELPNSLTDAQPSDNPVSG